MIHSRDAWDDTFRVLDDEGVPARTVFHCFTGGPDEARRALDARRVPLVQRHRVVQERRRRARRGGARAARPDARRDRRAVPRAGAAPGPSKRAGVGRRRRASRSPPRSGRPVDEIAAVDPRERDGSLRAPPLTCADRGGGADHCRTGWTLTTVTLRLRMRVERSRDATPTDDSTQRADPITEQLQPPRGSRPCRAAAPASSRATVPAHVATRDRPSPARAEPHDAARVAPGARSRTRCRRSRRCSSSRPDRRPAPATIDLAAIEAAVAPSPARAAPHDAAAWLPLPDDLDDLPPVHELLDPHPEVQAAVIAEAEAVVADAVAAAEASSRRRPPGPAPHDAAAWLPLPLVDELPPVTDLLEEATPPPATRRGKLVRTGPTPRTLGIALLVVATVLAGGWAVTRILAPAGSKITLLVDGTRRELRTEVATVGALLTAERVTLGRGDVVVPAARSALHDGSTSTSCARSPSPSTSTATTRTVRTVETTARGLARQLGLGKLTAVRNQPGRAPRRVRPSSSARASAVRSGRRPGGDVRLAVAHRRRAARVVQRHPRRRRLRGAGAAAPSSPTAPACKWCASAPPSPRRPTPIPFDTVQQADPDHPDRRDPRASRTARTARWSSRTASGSRTARRATASVDLRGPVGRADPAGSSGTAPTPTPAGTSSRMCESGGRWDTVDGAAAATRTTAGSASTAAPGGPTAARSSRPTRAWRRAKQQIIVGMRIYAEHGWDPWGCANYVLDWPRWGM